MTKDNMAKDSNGGATRDVALVGRDSGRSKGQDSVEEHYCNLTTHFYLVVMLSCENNDVHVTLT